MRGGRREYYAPIGTYIVVVSSADGWLRRSVAAECDASAGKTSWCWKDGQGAPLVKQPPPSVPHWQRPRHSDPDVDFPAPGCNRLISCHVHMRGSFGAAHFCVVRCARSAREPG